MGVGGDSSQLIAAPVVAPMPVADPMASVVAHSAAYRPTTTVRELARAGLRDGGVSMLRPGAGLDPRWHGDLRTLQAHLRLMRPVIDPAWNTQARELLRSANTLVTDLALLGSLLDTTDGPAADLLHERSIRTGVALHHLVRSPAWTGLARALRHGGWPVRQGRFGLDETAPAFLPGQLRPLFKKLESVRAGIEDDWTLRLVGKTTHRLAVGFEMLDRSGVHVAAEAASACRQLLDELEPALTHSRAVELLESHGLDAGLAERLRPRTSTWTTAVGRHLAGENLIRTPRSAAPVLAAGGVVWRRHEGRIEVVLVSRHRQRDWSLPKGKKAIDETLVECALRETLEETGLRCDVGEELLDADYRDRAGRAKHVRYWAMRPVGGELRPDREIGDVRWFELQAAIRTVTKERERHVIASLTAVAESVA